MFDDKLQLPEEPGVLPSGITKSAKHRRVYSEARKSLAVLPSTDTPRHAASASEPSDAAKRWRKASVAILKGIQTTNTVESTAKLLKYFSVTKELSKEQLLHEKFCHLLAIDGLEEKIAVRYSEATALAAKFRQIRSSLNSKEQLQAMDAAQSVLNDLEAVRRLFGSDGLDSEEAAERFDDIDDSLDDFRDLCEAKTLKSKFRRAGKHFITARRLSKAGQERTRKRLLREAFQRSVRKVTNVRALLRPSKDVEAEANRAASPASDFFQRLQTSQENFQKRSEEWKQSLAEEVLALGQQMPTSHRSGHFVHAPPPTPGTESAAQSPGKVPGSPAPFVFSSAVERRRNSLSERKRRDSLLRALQPEEETVAITSFDFLSQGQKVDRSAVADKRKMIQAKLQSMLFFSEQMGSSVQAPSASTPGLTVAHGPGATMQQMAIRMPASGPRGFPSVAGRTAPPTMASKLATPSTYKFQPLSQPTQYPQLPQAPALLSPLPPPNQLQPSSPVMPRSPEGLRLASHFFRKGTGELRSAQAGARSQAASLAPGNVTQSTGAGFRSKLPWSAFRLGNPAPKAHHDNTVEGTGGGGSASGGQGVGEAAGLFPPQADLVYGDTAAGAESQEKRPQASTPRDSNGAVPAKAMKPEKLEWKRSAVGGDTHTSTAAKLQQSELMTREISTSRQQQGASAHDTQDTKLSQTSQKKPDPFLPNSSPDPGPFPIQAIQKHLQQTETGTASFTATAGKATVPRPQVHGGSKHDVSPMGFPVPAIPAEAMTAQEGPSASTPRNDSFHHGLEQRADAEQDLSTCSPSVRGTQGGHLRQHTTPAGTPTAASVQSATSAAEAFPREPAPAQFLAGPRGLQDVQHTGMVMAELETLLKHEKSHQAAFAASAFLATVGLDSPLGPEDTRDPLPVKVQTYSGLLEVKKHVAQFVAQVENEVNDLEDPAEVLEKLLKLDRALSFLDQVGILESCLESAPAVELQPPDRGADYDWQGHRGSLKRVKSTLSSSESWRPLASDSSWQTLQETSHDSGAAIPERLEWIQESHPSLRASRSQHAEFAPQRKTLEKTVRERHQRGVRHSCVRPELTNMWQEYCRLVWKEDPATLSFSTSRSAAWLGRAEPQSSMDRS